MSSVEQRARDWIVESAGPLKLDRITPEEAWRIAYEAGFAAALREQPEARGVVDVECRECRHCGHVGINDESATNAACNSCEWSGPSPSEDKCPGCSDENCMGAACPKCGAIYRILAEASVALTAAQQPEDLKAWSLRMAEKEQGQHVSAGSHGIEDVPVQEGDGELPGMWSASDFTGSDPEERAQHRAMRAAPPSAPVGVEVSGYIATVPDNCDRIIWRGHYHHLPLTQQPAKAVPGDLTADEREWLDYAIEHMRDDSEPEDLTCADVLEALLQRATPPGDDAAGGGHRG